MCVWGGGGCLSAVFALVEPRMVRASPRSVAVRGWSGLTSTDCAAPCRGYRHKEQLTQSRDEQACGRREWLASGVHACVCVCVCAEVRVMWVLL